MAFIVQPQRFNIDYSRTLPVMVDALAYARAVDEKRESL